MVVKLYQLKTLSAIKAEAKVENRPRIDEVIKLYKERKIAQFATAVRIAGQLAGGTNSVQAGMKALGTQHVKKTVTGILKATTGKPQQFFVKGLVHTISKYQKVTNKVTKQYDKEYHDDLLIGKTIVAVSEDAAKAQYRDLVEVELNANHYSKVTKVSGVASLTVKKVADYHPKSEADTNMKAGSFPYYHFIPSDDKHLENQGFCVVDQFVGIYGPKIKKLTREYFICLCNEFYGVSKPTIHDLVDAGTESSGDDEKPRWDISMGVNPKCLTWICEKMNISCYSFDITQKCFMKYISPHRNYDALVYYCVNGHMYWISDKKAALSLTRKARGVETKIKSVVLADEFEKKNPFKNKEVLENIAVEDLKDHKGVVIIYNQEDLNTELDEIIRIYNYVPSVRNKLLNTVGIHFDLEGRDVYLATDPNDTRLISHKGIKILCERHSIEFSNQSFGGLIKELRVKFFADKSSRRLFSKQERLTMHAKCGGCCGICSQEVEVLHMQVDHIKPLAEGGSNGFDNLQVVCKQCHFQKTRTEQVNGYVKISDTASSFNFKTTEIFNSGLCDTHAFVETLKHDPPIKMKDNAVHHIDVNKSRKNCLLYSMHDYPLFTVMDQPVRYDPKVGYQKPGLYYVETRQYMPMRGNGWYSHAMIQYCIKENLIQEYMIQSVIYSSLNVPREYFNDFIDFLYSGVDEHGKLAPNTMIGSLKPKPRDNWKTRCITTDPNVAMFHFMKRNGCFIDSRDIGDTTYHQVYERFETERQETEAPIYNMVLEQEAMELHRLCKLVESKKGVVLDLSTDCVSCVFPTNELPFDLMQGTANLNGYFYDEEHKFPKYKIEHKDRMSSSRLPQHVRSSLYIHVDPKWNVIEDVPDNDFGPLVSRVLDEKLSANLLGRGGTGKTFFIEAMQKEMKARNLKFESLAPTNVAARLIGGKTIHKFAISQTIKHLRDMELDYMFVDEISLVPELFYKYFLVLEKALPKMRFIISGDYEQLLPVKDRVSSCDYQNSNVLHELCHGNRIQLTTCRRSDRELFDLVDPKNIEKLTPDQFGSRFTGRHLSFTNSKRKEINRIMMDRVAKSRRTVKPVEFKALDYDNNSQDVKLLAGCPIIARINCKEMDVWNNETFEITKIHATNKLIYITDWMDKKLEINFADFQKLFRPAYCITIHCAQGKTINEPYTIHNWEMLDKRLKYVALSRSTSKENINIC